MSQRSTEYPFELLFHFRVLEEAVTSDGLVDVLLAHDGLNRSENGDFIVDACAFKLIDEAFRKAGREFVIDYQHQSLIEGHPAPAAGWIQNLRYEKGRGLIAAVKWTARAREMIRAEEFKYISPVVVVRKDDGRAIELYNAALTNNPAIERMETLAASKRFRQENQVMAEKPETETSVDPTSGWLRLAKIFGITESMALPDLIDAIIAKATELMGGEAGEGDGGGGEEAAANSRKALANIAEAVGVSEDASVDFVIATINTLRQAGGDLKALHTEVNSLRDRLTQRDATDWLQPWRAKRLVPFGTTQEERARDEKVITNMAITDRDNCEHFLEQREKMYPPSGATTPPPDGGAGSTRTQIIVNAAREFNEETMKIGTVKSYVNESLREQGLTAVTEDESKKLVKV